MFSSVFRLDKFSKDTTVIHQIFGGFLRSQGMSCNRRICVLLINFVLFYGAARQSYRHVVNM